MSRAGRSDDSEFEVAGAIRHTTCSHLRQSSRKGVVMTIRLQQPGADLFTSGAHMLVNPVNTQGVMGAGLARAFKARFPAMFDEYRRRCLLGEVRIGRIDVHHVMDPNTGNSIVIANLPTKQYWRNPSRPEWVTRSVQALPDAIADAGSTSVAIPPLGCGLGGLSWHEIYPQIERAMAPTAERGVDVLVYPPA